MRFLCLASSLLALTVLVLGIRSCARSAAGAPASPVATTGAASSSSAIAKPQHETVRSTNRTPPRAIAPERNAAAGPAPAISITIIDDRGLPLEDAHVEVQLDGVAHTRRTDARGRCEVPAPPIGELLPFRAEKAGYFHSQGPLNVRQHVEIRLARLTSLGGRVVDARDGNPVAGATVSLQHPHCQGCDPDRVETFADGRFELAVAPLGSVRLDVRAAGFAPGQDRFVVRSPVRPSEREVSLRRTSRLRAVVVDASDGRAMGHAVLLPEGRPVEVDGTGFFDVVPGEPAFGGASAPGYCASRAPLDPSTEPFEVRLVRGAVVEGRVRAPTGEPVRGARVGFVERRSSSAPRRLPDPWRLTRGSTPSVELTKEDGRFQSPPLVPGESYSVRVTCSGYRTREIGVEPLGGPGDRTSLEVELEPNPTGDSRWRGRMLVNGEPIGGSFGWTGSDRSGRASVDALGRFEVGGLPAGAVQVFPRPRDRVGGRDYRRAFPGLPVEVTLPAGRLLTRDLDLELPIGPIAGVVLDAEGTPIERAAIEVFGSSSRARYFASASTDVAGAFRIDAPIGDGLTYKVTVRHAHTEQRRRSIAPGTHDLVFTLAPTATVRLQVRSPGGGTALESWDLYGRSPGDERFEIMRYADWFGDLDADGWFETELPAGTFELLVRPLDQPALLVPYRLAAGQVHQRTVELPETGPVELTLAPSSQKPKGVKLALVPAALAEELAPVLARSDLWGSTRLHRPTLAEAQALPVRFDDAGRARVDNVPDGVYALVMHPERFVIGPRAFELRGPVRAPWNVGFHARR